MSRVEWGRKKHNKSTMAKKRRKRCMYKNNITEMKRKKENTSQTSVEIMC